MGVGARFSEFIGVDEEVEVKKQSDSYYQIIFKKAGVEIIIHKQKLLELFMKFTMVV